MTERDQARPTLMLLEKAVNVASAEMETEWAYQAIRSAAADLAAALARAEALERERDEYRSLVMASKKSWADAAEARVAEVEVEMAEVIEKLEAAEAREQAIKVQGRKLLDDLDEQGSRLVAAEARVRDLTEELLGWETGAAETTRALHASGAYALRLIAAGDRLAQRSDHHPTCWITIGGVRHGSSDYRCTCAHADLVAAWEQAKKGGQP